MFDTLSILAPGLLGASLGLAAHERKLAREIRVWARRPEVRAACDQAVWCTAAPETAELAVAGAELIVVCTPVEHIVPLVTQIAPHLAPGAIVTDVGSTKGAICAPADGTLPDGRLFIGSHPMAGSEKSGMEHADASLFEGRTCFITPLDQQPADAVERVKRFWQAVGMMTRLESPEQHDAIVARVSHLPHLLASALSVTVGRTEIDWVSAAGGGLRDTTRVAAGHPGMWRDICVQNRVALLAALGDFRAALGEFESMLEDGDFDQLENLLSEGRTYRQRLADERS